MSRIFLLLAFLVFSTSLMSQEDTAKVEIKYKTSVHGGLFLGYSSLVKKQPVLSFQAFYERQFIPFLGISASQAYVQAWDNVKNVDTLAKIGIGYFKSTLAAQFIYPKISERHVLKASIGPAIYFGFISRLVNADDKLIGVLEPSKKNLSVGISGVVQYQYFTKKNIAIGVVASWDYVFKKKNFFGNILPGFTVGYRF